MKAINDLSAEYVRSLLSYDPLSGELRWRKKMYRSRVPAGSIAGHREKDGRMRVGIEGRHYQAARLAWLIVTGEWPTFDIDHRDLDKGNDRWKNLRLATCSQNCFNKRALRNNTSGFKGVWFDPGRSRYCTQIKANDKRIMIGRFDTAEEAARAYRDAAEREHGEFARF
jgi:HNH endonuclease/AP2 domain